MKRASLRRSNRKSALHRKSVLQRKAVALAVSSALMGLAGTAWGQAVTGTIEGTVPAAAGETIRITGGSGFDRTIKVDPSGRYSTTVPVGTYTVSLLQHGKVVQSKTGVSPVAAGAVTVVFSSATATSTTTALNTIVISATGTLSGMCSAVTLLAYRRSGYVFLIDGDADDARTVLNEVLTKRFTAPKKARSVASYASELAREEQQRRISCVPDTSSRRPATPEDLEDQLGVWRDPWFGEARICARGGMTCSSPRRNRPDWPDRSCASENGIWCTGEAATPRRGCFFPGRPATCCTWPRSIPTRTSATTTKIWPSNESMLVNNGALTAATAKRSQARL